MFETIQSKIKTFNEANNPYGTVVYKDAVGAVINEVNTEMTKTITKLISHGYNETDYCVKVLRELNSKMVSGFIDISKG